MQFSTYLIFSSSADRDGMRLVYSTLHSSVALLPEEYLDEANLDELEQDEAELLVRLGILVPDRDEERRQMLSIFERERPGTVFSAVVVLNLDCNLACPYCYEDAIRGKRYMSEETAARLIEIIKRERLDSKQPVHLTFYGGEPLLSTGLITTIASSLRAAAERNGVTFTFSLVTNGTLLHRQCVRELRGLGLTSARVTIDGPAGLHDRSRPFVSGLGSYETILKNVLECHEILPIQLGGNFTRETYREFPRMLDDLLTRGVKPDKIDRVVFSPVVPKAGRQVIPEFNTGCICSYEPWLVEAELFLREEILKRGFTAQKPGLAACMVALAHELVIDTEGVYFKCPAFMAYPHLRAGSLAEGVGNYAESHGLDIWKGPECLQCPYLPLCFGGCRQLTLLRTGSINEVDCRREYFEAVLEKIIRLGLKYRKTE